MLGFAENTVALSGSLNLPDAAFGRTVIRLSCIGFTLPKSAIFIWPSDVSNRFSGC